MDKHHIIYETKISYNGKTYYYRGKHTTKNLDDGYLGSGLILNKIIKHCQKNNIQYSVSRKILATASNEKEALRLEREYVNEEWLARKDTINIALGGQGGSLFGKKRPDHSERMRGSKNHFYGKKHSIDTIEKIRSKKIGKMTGKDNPFYGKTHSSEALEKIRKANIGRPAAFKGKHLSEETKQKLRLAHLGRKQSKETIEKKRLGLIGHTRRRTGEHWKHLEDLYKIWVDNSKPGYVNFRKMVIPMGYPDVNYKGMHNIFIKREVEK